MSHGLTTNALLTRDDLLSYRSEPVHIVGATSAEGVAVIRLFDALGFSDVTVHDMRERATLRKAFRTTHGAFTRVEQDALWESLKPTLAAGRFGDDYLESIEKASLVVLGQGWYLDEHNRQQLVERVAASARITSMMQCYFALHPGPIVGITGTNGKSTTVALAEHLLSAGDVTFHSAGNERSSRQFLPDIENVSPGSWALLEISNRQLLQTFTSPQVAAITALTPDHLDEHGGFAGYRETKAQLFLHQTAEDVAITNADDPFALEAAEASPAAAAGRLVRCGTGTFDGPCVVWRDDQLVAVDVPFQREAVDGHDSYSGVLASRADVQLPGEHNLRNVAVACALALACGAQPDSIAEGLRTFEGKALRLQRLDEVDGIEIWSDLKATTPEATIAALDALTPRPIVLIAGGEDKGLSYEPLAQAIYENDRVSVVLVPGSASDALVAAIEQLPGAVERIVRVDGLSEGLDVAFELAVSGGVVIVSPAAAGFWSSQLQGATSLRTLVRQRVSAPQEVPGQ